MTPWIFAAAAVAYVVWTGRRPAPAGLPPLVPAVPALPTLGPVTAPASGVSPFRVVASVAPWVLVAWLAFGREQHPTPAPDPDPTPASGLDLRGKFTGPHAFEDAVTTAAITGTVAKGLAEDGKIDFDGDGRTDDARLDTGRKVWELRNTMRAYHTGGVLLGDRQPMVRDEIKRYLDATCGKSSGELTPEQKDTWREAFEEIHKAATAAAGVAR